ncbi:MAG: beta galactosidase jelly roll domain-containing protein, partial [Kiritimatiellae bacterium]|nr:beta galactosidase jelly roll domain-containing protein [Kiritimatiellia bacterium]
MSKNGWITLLAGCLLGTAFAYQPKENPLMTVWGEKMTPESAWREYPRPNLVRERWQNLNGLWQYAVNKREEDQPAEWTGEILVPFPIESALSGVKRLMTTQEQLWYRRTFTAPVDAKRERLLLHFGAVDFRTQVWINGVEVTDVPHESGNLPFTLDITGFVKAGENELVLSVWDPTNDRGYYQSLGKQHLNPGGCMYTRVSGIWQTVWLETVPKTHITGYKVVTDIDRGTVAVTVDAAGNLSNAKVELAVKNGNDTVATGTVTAWGEPVVMRIANPRLWSPASPNLYDLVITLTAPGSDTDTVKGYFGMRKIEWRKDEKGIPRFYFNNQKLFLQGTLDQGWWPDGLLTPPSDDAMAYDINLLKSCGFNMMRKHIKI